MRKLNQKLANQFFKKYNPIEKKDVESLGFQPASFNDNKYKHIDGEVQFYTKMVVTHMSVDVKDRKSIKRGEPKNDRYLWVELQNCYGYHGWLYGEADFIAFKQADHWFVVWRKDLVELVANKVEKEFVDYFPLYKLKTRKGNKDIITLIDREDIEGIHLPL